MIKILININLANTSLRLYFGNDEIFKFLQSDAHCDCLLLLARCE